MGRLNFPQNTTIKQAYAAMANDSKFFIQGGVSICQAGVLFLIEIYFISNLSMFLLLLLLYFLLASQGCMYKKLCL